MLLPPSDTQEQETSDAEEDSDIDETESVFEHFQSINVNNLDLIANWNFHKVMIKDKNP